MQESEILRNEIYEGLTGILKPYQKEQNKRQKLAETVRLCARYVEKDDFLSLDELLKSRIIEEIVNEPGLTESEEFFNRLREYAKKKVDSYRIDFINDLYALSKEADLPLEIDFPRFSLLKGIDGSFNFSARTTTINKKVLKSINPQKIVAALTKIKRQLYDHPFDPQSFIDSLYAVYRETLDKAGKGKGETLTMQHFYLEYVISMQSKTFFQNMEKGKFRGYSLDEFAVDLWRYLQAGTGGALKKFSIRLSPGRNEALWLIDSDGKRRQITTISFQEK